MAARRPRERRGSATQSADPGSSLCDHKARGLHSLELGRAVRDEVDYRPIAGWHIKRLGAIGKRYTTGMEDEQWLQRLLESSRVALMRRREGSEPDQRLAADLEALCVRLEQRLRDVRGEAGN